MSRQFCWFGPFAIIPHRAVYQNYWWARPSIHVGKRCAILAAFLHRSVSMVVQPETHGLEARSWTDSGFPTILEFGQVKPLIQSDCWAMPTQARKGAAILHLHGGWFNSGTAPAFRNLVGHIAMSAGVDAFNPITGSLPSNHFLRHWKTRRLATAGSFDRCNPN